MKWTLALRNDLAGELSTISSGKWLTFLMACPKLAVDFARQSSRDGRSASITGPSRRRVTVCRHHRPASRPPLAIRSRLGLHEGAETFVPHPTMKLPDGISFDGKFEGRSARPVQCRRAVRRPAPGRRPWCQGRESAPRTRTVTYAELAERVNRAGNCAAGARLEARRAAADGW